MWSSIKKIAWFPIRDMLIHVAKIWSKRGGNGKPLQYSCYENLINMNRMKRQKDITLVDEIPLGG